MVHGGLRHARSRGSEGAARGVGVMTDDLVNNEMRLAAIEYLLCQLWVNSMKFGGVTEQEFAWRTDAMLANIRKQALPRFERWPTCGSCSPFGRHTTRYVRISKGAKSLKA